MEAKATLKSARLSPQKTRLVIDMIRGKGVQDALNILKFSPKRSAAIVSKLVNSAVANAEQNGVGLRHPPLAGGGLVDRDVVRMEHPGSVSVMR